MRTPKPAVPDSLKAVPPAIQKTGRKVRQRADGQVVRKQTFELNTALSKQLAVFCIDKGRSMTSVVEEGIRYVLSQG
jgi:hypothetical protein